MAHVSTTHDVSSSRLSLTRIPTLTATLLSGGVIAGPLFIGASYAQVLTRAGIDFKRRAISMLTLGDQGWIQSAIFEITGLLVLACAVGMRRVLRSGRASTGGPAAVRRLRPGPGCGRPVHAGSGARLPARGSLGDAGGHEPARDGAHARLHGLVRVADCRLLCLRPPVQRTGLAGMGGLLRGHRSGAGALHRAEPGAGWLGGTTVRDGRDHLRVGGGATAAAVGQPLGSTVTLHPSWATTRW
jgi:Protein of unknown function (DUF998)